MSLTIAILAGGQSRRFGKDKAALFLPKLLPESQATGLPIHVIGRTASVGAPPDVAFIPDDFPYTGPLSGLVTALRYTRGPILALPCDLPYLTQDALLWLAQRWKHSHGATCLVSRHADQGTLEPLFAIYFPDCLPEAEELIQCGRRAVRTLWERCNRVSIVLPREFTAQLHNVNTPADLLHREKPS